MKDNAKLIKMLIANSNKVRCYNFEYLDKSKSPRKITGKKMIKKVKCHEHKNKYSFDL